MGFEISHTEAQISALFVPTGDGRHRIHWALVSAPPGLLSESTALAAVTGKKQIHWVVLQNHKGLDVFS